MLNAFLWPRDLVFGDGTHQPNLMLNVAVGVVAFLTAMVMLALAWPMTLVWAVGAFIVAMVIRMMGVSGTIGGVLLASCLGVLLGVWF